MSSQSMLVARHNCKVWIVLAKLMRLLIPSCVNGRCWNRVGSPMMGQPDPMVTREVISMFGIGCMGKLFPMHNNFLKTSYNLQITSPNFYLCMCIYNRSEVLVKRLEK